MSEILLTHSYFLHFDPKQLRSGTPYPPLASLYAAAVLKQHAFSVAFHDTMFSQHAQEIDAIIHKEQPKLFVIYDDGFNYLTKMCLTNMRDAAFEMISIAKKAGCIVAVSSSDSTDHAASYLAHGADYIISGEGEQTLLELCNLVIRNEGRREDIAGLIYLENDKPAHTPKRENTKNLDSLPLPAWEILDAAPYRNAWLARKKYFSINMVTTRGCPFKCNWCAKPIYGNRYHSRSPEQVVKEIKWLQSMLGISHIWFADDIFGLKPGWVQRFSELIAKEKIHIRFKIQSRVDLLLEEDTIRYLAEAGCDEIWVGAESGSQKILDAMDKGTRVEQVEHATYLMKQHGIKPCFFLQFGYPGEDRNDIEQTVNMVQRLLPHDIGISVSYPLPGTKFYENVKSQLSLKQNWTDSDELLVMFRGTYSPSFYKQLQRLVHFRFRRWKALEVWHKNPGLKQIPVLLYRALQVIIAQQQLKKHAA